MSRFAAAAAALIVIAGASFAPISPAFAQAADIATFTVDNVSAVVREMGGTNLQTEKEGKNTFVNFDYQGQPISFSIRVCDASPETPGCLGLLMAMGFEMETPYALETFNNFNLRFPLATAVRINDKSLAFGRFVFSLGGLTRENIKANMGIMLAAPEIFAELLKAQVVASKETGSPTVALGAGAGGAKLKAMKLTAAQSRDLMNDGAVKVAMPKAGGK